MRWPKSENWTLATSERAATRCEKLFDEQGWNLQQLIPVQHLKIVFVHGNGTFV